MKYVIKGIQSILSYANLLLNRLRAGLRFPGPVVRAHPGAENVIRDDSSHFAMYCAAVPHTAVTLEQELVNTTLGR